MQMGIWSAPICGLGYLSKNWPVAAIYGGILSILSFKYVEKRAAVTVFAKNEFLALFEKQFKI